MDLGVGWPDPGVHAVVGSNRGEQLVMQGMDVSRWLNQDRRRRLESRVYRLPFMEARIFFRTMWSLNHMQSRPGREDSFLIKP
jgi:hypothetical protein